VATTSWRVLARSTASSFWVSAASSAGLSRFAPSTTRPVSLGKVWAEASSAANSSIKATNHTNHRSG
jgi:hypothetical protein